MILLDGRRRRDTGGGLPATSYYTMDNITGSTLVDETGGHDGAITGATQVTGYIGSALSFDGNDHVDLGNACHTDSFGVSFWIKTSVSAGRIFDSRGTGAFGTVTGVQIKSWGAISDIAIVDDGSGNSISWSNGDVHTNYTDGSWHHIILNYDSATKTGELFVDNGTPSIKTNTSLGSVISPNTLFLGRAVNTTTQWLSGSIDQLRILDRPFTNSEITAMYIEV